MGIRFRQRSFEVQGLNDGRWTIHSTAEDEAVAVAEANRLLARGKLQAVRVMAVRTTWNVFPTGALVFEKAAPELPKPVVLRAAPDGTPLCTSADHLYGPQARQAIGHILRDYLTRQQITPTELLYGAAHLRRLQDTGAMLQAALHKVATVQARLTGETSRARIRQLDDYVDAVLAAARDFQAASRKWTVPLNGEAAALSAAVKPLAADIGHDRAFLGLMAVRLGGIRSLGGKLEEVLRLMAPDTPWPVQELLDGIAADLLRFPDVIQDLFGNRRCLADFLVALADLLRAPEAVSASAKADTSLALMACLLMRDRLPQGRAVLLEWLAGELSSEHPLNRHDPAAEPAELERIHAALRLGDGPALVGGAEVEQALAARRLILRRHALRGEGLHIIADSLKPESP